MNATAVKFEPKSYLSEEEKAGMSEEDICFFELCRANKAHDDASFWYWLKRINPGDSVKETLAIFFDQDFLAEKGLSL
ncbi:MAG: hypothetical protein LBI31_00710 [Zoogloeaceae bacterium]|jgi:hypothetical protein|nr:hypothetical protein [Zoogloeaceae bacterium]